MTRIPTPDRCRRSARILFLLLLAAAGADGRQGAPARRARPAPPAPAPRYTTRQEHDANGTGRFYMGREIAQVMGHEAADWLDRPERDQEEQPAKLLEALRLRPGQNVADIGAGSGYYTLRIAPRVAPAGKVYAVEIQPEMLAIIRKRAGEQGVKNVELILGKIDDPKLPPNSQDLILLVDVYHEFSHPWEMAQAMARALKPGGRLVFVEFRLEDPEVPIKLVHKMSVAQVKKEMAAQPLRWVETSEILPWQHIIWFEKPRPAAKPGAGAPQGS